MTASTTLTNPDPNPALTLTLKAKVLAVVVLALVLVERVGHPLEREGVDAWGGLGLGLGSAIRSREKALMPGAGY